jgi:tetraacyldisaccharide 4'-kinase
MLINLSKGFKWLLWPFSVVFTFVVWIRNYLYNKGLLEVYQSDIFTINIGNLTVGGTGKTPHIEYLVRLLSPAFKVAVLSRGYGRQTTGFRAATATSSAAELGDEPLQIFQKFDGNIPVFVCEKRAEGLRQIEQRSPQTQLVLLDDAFQHRAVKPHFNILLTDYKRLFYEDFVLPVGLLREPKQGAKRADAVVVSKCPSHLSGHEKERIIAQIKQYVKAQVPVFFSTFDYDTPRPYFEADLHSSPPSSFWLLSGIAQPQLFEDAAVRHFTVKGHSHFGDHHKFKISDLERVVANANHSPILTTEKDFVKIKPLLAQLQGITSAFYYWPIEVRFWDTAFDTFLQTRLSAHQ